MEINVKMSTTDRDQIERLHYQVEARANLMERIASRLTTVTDPETLFHRYLGEYDSCFMEYTKKKEWLEQKYKPAEIAETAISWRIDFEAAEIIFEVPDAAA